MREAICDIETDDLDATVIHCAVLRNLHDKNDVEVFRPSDIDKFIKRLGELDLIVGHNFLTFDSRAIKKVKGLSIPIYKIVDTLILSRMVYTGYVDKYGKPFGSHSLEAWGSRLGYPKIEFSDFREFSETMLTYCEGDTLTNWHVYHHLKPLVDKFSEFSVRLEHNIQDILNDQKENGFYLDIDKVRSMHRDIKERLNDTESKIVEAFPPRKKLVEVYRPRIKQDGEMFANAAAKLLKYELKTANADGSYNLYEMEYFNIGSPKQVVSRLNEVGWSPVEFTKAGNPKISEANFETLADPDSPAKHIGTWLMLNNRLKVLEGWMDSYNPLTHCIHGTTIGLGAVTHRMAHYDPQMANIPAVRSEYGSEFRSCLTIRDKEKHRIVGVDISGIQLRILAHYMRDDAYAQAVCFGKESEGTDIHTVQRNIIREIVPFVDRDGAKKFIYSMILGASGFKLGVDMGTDAKHGQAAKDKLFERIPAFRRVQAMCKKAAKRGYIIGIDGRHTLVKSEHFALSVYLQCAEAVIMKYALCLLKDRAAKIGLWFKQLVVVHDEVQCECKVEDAETLGKLVVECIRDAGVFFELSVPLTGGYKIGVNWKETH